MTDAPSAAADHFQCVDSAPRDFAAKRPGWLGISCIGLFLLLSISGLILTGLSWRAWALFPSGDLILAPVRGDHAVPVRLFLLCFFMSFFAVIHATPGYQLAVWVQATCGLLLTFLLTDLWLSVLFSHTGLMLSVDAVAILSGLLGFHLFAMLMLDCAVMPARIAGPDLPRRPDRQALLRLGGAILFGVLAALLTEQLMLALVLTLRDVSFLGGIGPGVFLVLPLLFTALVFLALKDRRKQTAFAERPAITVFAPAHNEEHIITATIEALDRAAAHYGAPVHLLLLDNCSTDDTAAIAEAAIARCAHLTGQVDDIPTPGKAIALNEGIRRTTTEIAVRLDCDTLVHEDALTRIVDLFADPRVGVVGGLPVAPGDGFMDPARSVEVLIKHGFYQVSLAAIDGTVGVPGMLAAYRRDLVLQLGGFAEGMNGEDTDISLRIGELGYRVLTDARIKFTSEVPLTWRHLREQRLRWFRSTYHVTARNRAVLFSWRSLRGMIVLPYMLSNTARRTMMLPLVLFGALCWLLAADRFPLLKWEAILATLMGAPLIVAILTICAHRQWALLTALPEYLVFRALRSFLTLESALTIRFAPRAPAPKQLAMAALLCLTLPVMSGCADGQRTAVAAAKEAKDNGRTELFAELSQTVNLRYPTMIDGHLLRGAYHLSRNELEQSERHFSEVIRRRPRAFNAFWGLTRIRLKQHRFGEAQVYAANAIAFDFDQPYSYLQYAESLFGQGQTELADKAIRKGLQLSRTKADYQFGAGKLQHKAGRHDHAIAAFDDALRRGFKDRGKLLFHRADASRAAKRFDQAIADFRAATEAGNRKSFTFFRLGQSYQALDRFAEAEEAYTAAIRTDALLRDIAARSRVRGKLKDYRGVTEDLSALIARGEPTAKLYIGRAAAFKKLGMMSAARADLKAALRLEPDNQKARKALQKL